MISYSAIDILGTLTKFIHLTPEWKSISDKELSENPPRYYRALLIKSLCRALISDEYFKNKSFAETISALLGGEFIELRSEKDFQPVFNILTDNAESKRLKVESDFITLTYVFQSLLKYRINLSQALDIKSKYIEAGREAITFFKITDKVKLKTEESLHEIDQILTLTINPKQKSIREDLLIQHFGWEEVDC